MRVNSFLVQGDGAGLSSKLGSIASTTLNALVLMSLGVDQSTLLSAIADHSIQCPVYFADSYGIIGWDESVGKNVELMEKGRGSEYGFQGGSGGQGCLVLAYSGGAKAGHSSEFPSDASSLMVVADTSKAFAKDLASSAWDGAPLHYGGIAKEAYVLKDGALSQVPYFWIASPSKAEPIGVSTFTEDAGKSAAALIDKTPSGWAPSTIGLFPCFTRGVNLYKQEDVESAEIGERLPKDTRVYGMFAHGELGPSGGIGHWTNEPIAVPHEQHSMTSILAVHTMAESAVEGMKEEV